MSANNISLGAMASHKTTKKNFVHYEAGSEDKIAFVFSCPGRREEEANPPGPAKGQTGENLKCLLRCMRNRHGIKGFRRGLITITNAWEKVEYCGKTERSEPPDAHVKGEKNIARLTQELQNITDLIICCGV